MEPVDTVDEETPLVVVGDQAPNNHTREMSTFSASPSCSYFSLMQNLQSTVNTEEALGTTSLGILYLSFTFFSVVASFVVRLLGSKNALILGTTGYWLFIAANLKPTG